MQTRCAGKEKVVNMMAGLVWMDTYVEGLTFGFVVLGVIGALIQWNRQLKREAAEFLKELLDELRSPGESSCVYSIDYGKAWYDSGFHGSEMERKIDRAFSFLSFVCYLRSRYLLGKREFKFFEYELTRALESTQTVDYLYNLHHFAAKNDAASPFECMVNYGVEVGLVDETVFFDAESYKRVDYLHGNLNF